MTHDQAILSKDEVPKIHFSIITHRSVQSQCQCHLRLLFQRPPGGLNMFPLDMRVTLDVPGENPNVLKIAPVLNVSEWSVSI